MKTKKTPEPTVVVVPPFGDGPLLKQRHAFWLLVLVEVGLLIFLLSHFPHTIEQRSQVTTALAQRREQASEIARAQSELQSLINDLLQVAKTDAQAATLVTKYQARQSPVSK